MVLGNLSKPAVARGELLSLWDHKDKNTEYPNHQDRGQKLCVSLLLKMYFNMTFFIMNKILHIFTGYGKKKLIQTI